MIIRSSCNKSVCRTGTITVLLLVAGLAVYMFMRSSPVDPDLDLQDDVTEPLPPSSSIRYMYPNAAVVTNGGKCANMANNILRQGGNAVDAIITAMLCDGVSCPQSMGLGGGFLLTMYNRKLKQSISVDAREAAPSKVTPNMFHGNAKASQTGPLAIGVPGELRGYWRLYQKYGGGVPWKNLFTEVIDLARTGIPVSPHLAKNIGLYEGYIRKSEQLTALFINSQNVTKTAGDNYTWPTLANTLSVIAEEGGDALHNGSLTKVFVEDIQRAGGIITEEDMNNYEVKFEKPIVAELKDGATLWTTPLPGSGLILSFMLRVLQHLVPAPSPLLWHQRFTETMKYAYAYRGYLGDNSPNVKNPYESSINKVVQELQTETFVNEIRNEISDTRTWQNVDHYKAKFLPSEDHGTANIVVISSDGDAVVATSTVNLVFGSRFVSSRTGIILNDEMDDFSSPNITNFFQIPPSPANSIQPGKRPLSSMCPTIITDKDGNVKIAVGAAGGTKITTSVAQVIMLNLWMNQTIKESVDAARIHHQLYPMKYGYEHGVLRDIVRGMRNIGHVTNKLPNVFTSSVTAISTMDYADRRLTANADFRRPGAVAGY